jgi:hypothetical protein
VAEKSVLAGSVFKKGVIDVCGGTLMIESYVMMVATAGGPNIDTCELRDHYGFLTRPRPANEQRVAALTNYWASIAASSPSAVPFTRYDPHPAR